MRPRPGLILPLAALIFSLVAPPVPAGGVVVTGTALSDNGDDDGYADTNETVSMRLVVENASGIDLTGVMARITTDQSDLACVTDPIVSLGDLAAGETRTSVQAFVFVVAGDVERQTVLENLSLSFRVRISSDQIADPAGDQQVTLDLDLDAVGGSGSTSYFESFETGDLGSFSEMNLDFGLHDMQASDGYRCFSSAPASTEAASRPA